MTTAATTARTRTTPRAPGAPRTGAVRRKKTAAAATVIATPQNREIMIAEAAYYRAERRGFLGGAEADLADWLEAEKEIDRQFTAC